MVRITKLTAVSPAETADCPIWLNFLNEATGFDEQLIRFLQQLCGHALTGSIAEHVMAFVYGGGGNGQSVFINTVSAILSDPRLRTPRQAPPEGPQAIVGS